MYTHQKPNPKQEGFRLQAELMRWYTAFATADRSDLIATTDEKYSGRLHPGRMEAVHERARLAGR